MQTSVKKGLDLRGGASQAAQEDSWPLAYFVITVLGFSFWFFLAVPFASHRETYWWLAMVPIQPLQRAVDFISVTYRPLAQTATWLSFVVLDPGTFPTNTFRQALFQVAIFGMFALAWWLMFRAASQRRLFALIACITGAVYFSGYVHLFHIYGLFYVPVMLVLGALFRFHVSRALHGQQLWFPIVAILLVLWHPFATALFVGFYCGVYLESFRRRSRAQHVQALVIILVALAAIAALVVPVPRTEILPLKTRVLGWLVSYQTNEVNRFASLVSLLLAQAALFSMRFPQPLKLGAAVAMLALGGLLFVNGLPLLFLWLCAAAIKLAHMRCWSLFILQLTAVLLPFGGGIGTPIYGLFAIIVAVYATSLGWHEQETTLSGIPGRYVSGTIAAALVTLAMMRAGMNVPVVTNMARPLLVERERTYQLETMLAWLHASKYCGCDLSFLENGGNPVDSVEKAITRRNRPPAGLEDVRMFWTTILQCKAADRTRGEVRSAVMTFGGAALPNFDPVFRVQGTYAGDATIWIGRN